MWQHMNSRKKCPLLHGRLVKAISSKSDAHQKRGDERKFNAHATSDVNAPLYILESCVASPKHHRLLDWMNVILLKDKNSPLCVTSLLELFFAQSWQHLTTIIFLPIMPHRPVRHNIFCIIVAQKKLFLPWKSDKKYCLFMGGEFLWQIATESADKQW